MSAKRKHRTANAYLKYLKGELSHGERYAFERDLEADPFDKEAMEGLELGAAVEIEEDLLSLHTTLGKRLRRRRRRAIYSIAASVASLLIVGSVFVNIYDFSPRSAEETLPKDESFLHEMQEKADLPEVEAPEVRPPVTEKEDLAPEKDYLAEEEIAEEALVEMEIADAAPAPERAAIQENKAIEARVRSDEVVHMEAAPMESRKKSRAQGMGKATPAPASVTGERVSGIVVSSVDMEPLPGASIVIKESDSGMVADMEGRFSLVADQQDETTVIARYVGMETDEYKLRSDTENRLVMQPDMATLDEVVVVGYGAEQETEEDIIYSGAEPEGGIQAYKMYMEEHLRFPDGDSISKRGVVVLKFNIEADGSISDIITLRSPGEKFTEVAISLLKEGPSWNPARDESGTTDDVVRMRIVFKR